MIKHVRYKQREIPLVADDNLQTRSYTMDNFVIINAVLLYIFNSSSMIIGLFLNTIVVASFKKSNQLRSKLCYYMILVLACIDLIVVTVTHPLIMLSISAWCIQSHKIFHEINAKVSAVLYGSSMITLLTMNIERYLALSYPFLHQTSVTKCRLLFLLFFQIFFWLIIWLLSYENVVFATEITPLAIMGTVLILLAVINFKIFKISKTKRQSDNKIAESIQGKSCRNNYNRRRRLFYKDISSCVLVVLCGFICSFPAICYQILHLKLEVMLGYDILMATGLWASSIMSFYSCLNCIIFFWKNETLRREGMKIIKHL